MDESEAKCEWCGAKARWLIHQYDGTYVICGDCARTFAETTKVHPEWMITTEREYKKERKKEKI